MGSHVFVILLLQSLTSTKVYSALFHPCLTSQLVRSRGSQASWEIAELKLISASHAVTKHWDFLTTDKASRHLPKLFCKAEL